MDGYSRLVGWLKVALPLLALAILSSLFLLTRRIDPESAIPYSDAEIADRLREPRMTDPAFAGTTRDGAMVTITAAEARPAEDGGGAARDIRAQLATPDGTRSALTSAGLRYDRTSGLAVFEDGVLFSNSLGYEFRTDSMSLHLDRTGAESGGEVQGHGPLGQLTAGRMELRPAEDGASPDSGYLLVFNGGVRLIYQPRTP